MPQRSPSAAQDEPERLLGRKELKRRWDTSLSSLYRMEARGDLPPPLQLGPQAQKWWLSTIKEVEARFSKRIKSKPRGVAVRAISGPSAEP